MVIRALSEGWVVVESGMRGQNCIAEGPNGEVSYNYGKLPNPIVDLKAAIRYLRYGDNEALIPGDEELIFAMGSSSGGCASSVLGASGNTGLYDAEFAAIGAAPGRDDVFAAAPSCPVITRHVADPALAWERWGDAAALEDASELNLTLTSAFVQYLNDLDLIAVFDAGDGIKTGDSLTSDNYADYMMVYVKQSLIKQLNGLGGKTAIDTFIAGTTGASNDMYTVPPRSRAWIKPVYDAANPNLVVDIDNTWTEYMTYLYGVSMMDVSDGLDGNRANGVGKMQYDTPMLFPGIGANGVGTLNDIGSSFMGAWSNASTCSFGLPTENGAVYSDVGWEWITSSDHQGVTVSDAYKELIRFQRNSADPLYFVLGGGAADVTVAKHWFLRAGSIDIVPARPIFFGLATALDNRGANVDAGLVWDQGHGLTSDVDGFFAFAHDAVAKKDGAVYTVTFDANGGSVRPAGGKTGVATGKLAMGLPTPTRSGYAFAGWFTAASGGAAVTADTLYTADTTIYAHWTAAGGSGGGGSAGIVSGGGGAIESGAVTVASSVNGVVAASPTNPVCGGLVTVTVRSDTGYKLGSLVITDSSGNQLNYNSGSGGDVYSFTYGSSPVVVQAVFVPLNAAPAPSQSASAARFSDVREADWFYGVVRYVCDKGLMAGVTADEFAPNTPTSRAMVVTVLHRLEGAPRTAGANSFTDLTQEWYRTAVQWAVECGITSGTGETTFDPDAGVTREQLAAFLYRYARYKGYDTSGDAALTAGYSDAGSISSWAVNAMNWANAKGIMTGETATALNPAGTSSRAVFAAVITRFLESVITKDTV
jgi:uncharacterized repeat protein (TIGR02543 family)